MLQVDGLADPNPQNVSITVIPVINVYQVNTVDTIWAGDLSSVSVEKYFNKKHDWKSRFLYSKRSDANNKNKSGDQIMNDYNSEVLKFYYDSGIPEKDRVSDFIGWFVYQNYIERILINSADKKDVALKIAGAVKDIVANKQDALRKGIIRFFRQKDLDPYSSVIPQPAYNQNLKDPALVFTALWFRVRAIEASVGNLFTDTPLQVKDESLFVMDNYITYWLHHNI